MSEYTVVTHKGQAHADDFIACCLLMAAYNITAVFRRDPTEQDMANESTFVVDQGGELDPDMGNLDHHQFDRDVAPTCSITLVIIYMLGWSIGAAREIFPWLWFKESIDSKGPGVTAKKLGITTDAMLSTLSPVESQMIRLFETQHTITSGSPLFEIMRTIGNGLITYHDEISDRIALLGEHAVFHNVNGHMVADFSSMGNISKPTMGVEVYLKGKYPSVVATITVDERDNTNLSLFRRDDHPAVDFGRIAGMDGAVFVHANGFVAKVKATSAIQAMLDRAIVG